MKLGKKSLYEENLFKDTIDGRELEEISPQNITRFLKNSDKRMKRYIKMKKIYKNPMFAIGKNVMAFCVFFIICAAMTYKIDARAIIFNAPLFVVDSFENYVRVRYFKDEIKDYSVLTGTYEFYEPCYIPDGYQKSKVEESEIYKMIIYASETNENICYVQTLICNCSAVDFGKENFNNISTEKEKIYAKTDDGSVFIIWYLDEYQFILSGKSSIEELIEVKKSLKRV